jgi:hypothetical protein
VDVPNNDTTLPFQAYEVHRLTIDAQLQPEVIAYSFIGGETTNGSVNLKLVRSDSTGKIIYNVNVTIQYGCSASTFLNAINNFDSFYPYLPSVVRNNYDSADNLTNATSNISRIEYVVSLYKLRDLSYQRENFVVTKINYKGNFTKTILFQHSPLISGFFSFNLGGISLNGSGISFDVNPSTLQSYLRTIDGYENVEVESKSQYGCGYSCFWIISYKGVNAAIPNITLNAGRLTGGSAPPTATLIVRRYYSPKITFEPIDYRFLNTQSNLPNVLVSTNGVPAVCTGTCSYQFNKAAVIQSWSFAAPTLTLAINNSSKISL